MKNHNELSWRKYYLVILWLFLVGNNSQLAQTSDYPIQPVPFTEVTVNDNFWAPKIRTNHDVTIPHGFIQSANRLLNFEIAAGIKSGSFASEYPFDDSDIYKMIEAASYSLHYFPDSELEKFIDSVITIIGKAQEPDGYLYTNRTIAAINHTQPHPWAGNSRWVNEHILSHELYNLGHLFEAAVAYYQATGKDNLLKIAIKAADLVDRDFGWGKLEEYPGHQIIETGLVRLYRATGDDRYLRLAKFFLDVRGPGGEEYCQAHEKVVNQTEAVGHAVRAVYMYSGMADVAAITRDTSYIKAIDTIWEDIVRRKIYITGGIGASGGNEGFNGAYNLPNSSAYCETCASIGNIYLNQRLFLLHGEAKYIDILERTLYNALLSGISLSGNRFFYPNPLQSTGSHQRSVWFGCACCPPNIARLIPSVPGYIYAKNADTLYVNLFIKSSAKIDLNGRMLEISQNTEYPWDGHIEINVNPGSLESFALLIRIPGWARNEVLPGDLYKFTDVNNTPIEMKLNGEVIHPTVYKGYAVLNRTWSTGDVVTITLPMNPRKIVANERVEEDKDRMAIQKGPFVFCAEGIDNNNRVLDLYYDKNAILTSSYEPALLNGTVVVKTDAVRIDKSLTNVCLIPYFLWNNRGRSEMQVWLSTKQPAPLPDSLILLHEDSGDFASTNYVSPWENLKSIYDLYDPSSSSDKGSGAFGNWQSEGGTINTWNWVQYNFAKKYTISSAGIYWWDDHEGIALPDSCFISYWDAVSGKFKVLETTRCGKKTGTILPDQYNYVYFGPVFTDKIRLNFIGYHKAQGILEWKVYMPSNVNRIKKINKSTGPHVLFPNPSPGKINIEVETGTDTLVEIYNMAGQLVFKENITGRKELESSLLGGKGTYLVKIGNDASYSCQKIVIN